MTIEVERIGELKDRVIQGGEISSAEALELLCLELPERVETLLNAAGEITLAFRLRKPSLCSLVNAKSYLCGEDCGFCAQSARFKTSTPRYELLEPKEILAAAKKAESYGVRDFCIVTSGGELSEEEFASVLEAVDLLKKETALGVDASLGFLTLERVRRLKEAGLRRFNNNLQTSREFYSKIVTTHSYEKRIESLEYLKAREMEICSGGILGLGETRRDRIQMAFELKRFEPTCLPINILNPRPGTPLEGTPKLSAEEILKTVAVYRFILPRSDIKLAGGREANLSEEDQERALTGGANGMILGGYLTTQGSPLERDINLLRRAGYEVSEVVQ